LRLRAENPEVQTELNIALGHHLSEENAKGVLLPLDAHAPAPSLRFPDSSYDQENEGDEGDRFLGFTAIEEAWRSGNVRILERLGPDLSLDNFDKLHGTAANGSILQLLARSEQKVAGQLFKDLSVGRSFTL
jgi:hypothetical protein